MKSAQQNAERASFATFQATVTTRASTRMAGRPPVTKRRRSDSDAAAPADPPPTPPHRPSIISSIKAFLGLAKKPRVDKVRVGKLLAHHCLHNERVGHYSASIPQDLRAACTQQTDVNPAELAPNQTTRARCSPRGRFISQLRYSFTSLQIEQFTAFIASAKRVTPPRYGI